MKHTEKFVVMGVLITGWAILLSFAYIAFFPIKTMEIMTEEPVKVLNPEKVVLPGETLSYELDYCKYTEVRAIVHRTLIDGQVITLQDTQGGIPMGCAKRVISTAIIPTTINPGEYYLHVELEYKLNFFRVERVSYRTEYFRVAAPVQPEGEYVERDGKTIYVPYPTYTTPEGEGGSASASSTRP
jgi:hypothetical protein